MKAEVDPKIILVVETRGLIRETEIIPKTTQISEDVILSETTGTTEVTGEAEMDPMI